MDSGTDLDSKPGGYFVHIAQTRTWIPTPYVCREQESEFVSVSGNVNEPLAGPSVFTSSPWSRRSALRRRSCWRVWARLHCAHSPSPLCCWTPPSRSRHPSLLACCKIPRADSNYSSNVKKWSNGMDRCFSCLIGVTPILRSDILVMCSVHSVIFALVCVTSLTPKNDSVRIYRKEIYHSRIERFLWSPGDTKKGAFNCTTNSTKHKAW